MCGNAGEMPAEVGKRHESLSMAYEFFLVSSSTPRRFPTSSKCLQPPLWLESGELRWRKVEEVGGAP